MTTRIQRVAVIGAGTMGSQIAALLASLGLRVRLYDIVPPGATDRNQLARQALERLRTMKPAPAYTPEALQYVEPANLEDHLPALAEADWVVEAVVERLPVKHEVWRRLAAHVRPDALLSTNTSGLRIASIAEALPAPLRPRFLGTHFFNPPRYLRLLEVIPGPETDPALVEAVAAFGRDVLGKGVVICRDTPYFIGNRLGIYGMMAVFRAMEEFGLDPAAVDAITGPAMGRPKSATFRTLDIVGLDVFADVVRNLAEALPEEAGTFVLPGYVEELIRRGHLGEKTRAGFYRKENGEILVIDPKTLEYRPRTKPSFPSLNAARNKEDLAERVRLILDADDPAGRFAWRVTSALWRYAAEHLEEIAGGRVDAVDKAMRWGFGWEMGPFETWDAYGVEASVRRMEAEGVDVPRAVQDLLASGRSRWYEERDGRLWCWVPGRGLQAEERDPRALSFRDRKKQGGLVRAWPGASLVDLGEGVLGVEFHSLKDAIGPDIVEALNAAADQASRWRAIVIGTDRANFGVGANLMMILMAVQQRAWDQIEQAVRTFQDTLMRLKYLEIPVVSAVCGLTLGGAAEIALHSARVVAAAETYMGLVEVGAGLVPGGGGCKEMLFRALEALPPATGGGAGPAGGIAPDPQPYVARAFQTIATAQVATSAAEARQLGFLRPCDRIVANRDQLLWVARQEALRLAEDGWLPPLPRRVPAPGPDVRAALEWAAYYARQAGQATDYDVRIAREVAYILTGGDLPAGTPLSEQDVLDLEREAFVRLCQEAKTQERMVHILQTGKPLRN